MSVKLFRKARYIFRKNLAPIFIILFISSGLLLVVKARLDNQRKPIEQFFGNYSDIIIPAKSFQKKIKYSDILMFKKVCINRNNYQNEFLRLININPEEKRHKSMKAHIVFGSNTDIGREIVLKLKKDRIHVIPIPEVESISLSDDFYNYIFDLINISHVIIATKPFNPPHSRIKDYSNSIWTYYQTILQYFTPKFAKIAIVMSPPYDFSNIDSIKWFGASLFLIPSFKTTKFDYNGILSQIDYYCGNNLTLNIFDAGSLTTSTHPSFYANHIIDKFHHFNKVFINLKDNHSIKLSEQKSCSNLQMYEEKVPMPALFQNENVMSDNYKEPKQFINNDKNVSLTIIITAISERIPIINQFIKNFEECVFTETTELLIVIDISFDQSLLVNKRDNIHLIVSEIGLKNYFSDFSPGISAAKGKFILFTDPDIIIPNLLFNSASRGGFNEGSVYRAMIMKTNISIDNDRLASLLIHNPILSHPNISLIQECLGEKYGCYFHVDKNRVSSMASCGISSFLLVSKSLIESFEGLPRIHRSKASEKVLHSMFMRLIPGFLEQYLYYPVFRYQHNYPNLNITDSIDYSTISRQLLCNGHAPTLKYQ